MCCSGVLEAPFRLFTHDLSLSLFLFFFSWLFLLPFFFCYDSTYRNIVCVCFFFLFPCLSFFRCFGFIISSFALHPVS